MHVILVFGCPAFPNGHPRPSLLRRLQAALTTARSDPSAQLVLSGASVQGPCEAHAMTNWLVAQGIEPHRCHPEPLARTTRQNAEQGVALARALGATKLSLVTEQYHLPRAHRWVQRVLRREQWPLELQLVGAPPAPHQPQWPHVLLERAKLLLRR